MARRFQFRLKSLMAAVVLICLGLGGWHLLWTKGQYVEAEPVVVGQPIKIRGRFFHFCAGEDSGKHDFSVECDSSGRGMRGATSADNSGWGRYDFEIDLPSVDVPCEFTITLTPKGHSPIRGSFVVRGEE